MTQPEAVAPDQWGELERLAKEAADVVVGPGSLEWYPERHLAAHLEPRDAAMVAQLWPATVLELIAAARSVGTSKASEPQNNPHPGRGEGDHYGGVTDMIDEAARAPTTYGKGEREEPVSNRYKFDDEIAWLKEASRYFSNRPTGGEDSAHWANIFNALNATNLAKRLRALQLGRGET